MTLKEKMEKKLVDSEEIVNAKDITILEPKKEELFLAPTFVFGIDEAQNQIRLLQEFIKHLMIPGQDFGIVPGVNKPSLFKSGAEKLCEIYGFIKTVEVTNRIEDWNKPFVHYEVKVILRNKRTGCIEAEGLGSCNSLEHKYARQNAYSIANTILKMGKKRALVDAVLSATRSSGIFTQDIEDMDLPFPAKKTTKSFQKEPAPSGEPASKAQLNKIFVLVRQANISSEEARNLLKEKYGIETSQEMSKRQASEFINYLDSKSKKPA